MNKLLLYSLVAGVCFGVWPLFANRSGLSTGNMLTLLILCVATLFVSFFAFAEPESKSMGSAKWGMVIAAGLISAVGMMFFNAMLAKAEPKEVGGLFISMVLVQTAVPVIYQVVMDKKPTDVQICGFILAIIAVVLINKH